MKRQVNVYRNLHKKGMFSIRLSGKVIDWASTIVLSGNIAFHIGEKGRVRVTEQRKKNVHSWIKADDYKIINDKIALDNNYKELWYSPYFTQHYYCLSSGNIVVGADEVVLHNDRAYALNPAYSN